MKLTGWSRFILLLAGLIGLAGVALAAAARHRGGGDLAGLAATFLLLHAAVLTGLSGVLDRFDRWRGVLLSAAILLGVGVVLFAGDLAALGFGADLPSRMLAPIGGSMMLGGWLLVVLAPMLPPGHET